MDAVKFLDKYGFWLITAVIGLEIYLTVSKLKAPSPPGGPFGIDPAPGENLLYYFFGIGPPSDTPTDTGNLDMGGPNFGVTTPGW